MSIEAYYLTELSSKSINLGQKTDGNWVFNADLALNRLITHLFHFWFHKTFNFIFLSIFLFFSFLKNWKPWAPSKAIRIIKVYDFLGRQNFVSNFSKIRFLNFDCKLSSAYKSKIYMAQRSSFYWRGILSLDLLTLLTLKGWVGWVDLVDEGFTLLVNCA